MAAQRSTACTRAVNALARLSALQVHQTTPRRGPRRRASASGNDLSANDRDWQVPEIVQ